MHAAGFGPLAYLGAALAAIVFAFIVHAFSRRKAPARGDRAALRQVVAAMHEVAGRIGIPGHVLPGLSEQADGAFIEAGPDGGFVYVTTEKASRMSQEHAADADELLYLVFRDRAWMHSYMALMGQDLSPEVHAARLAEGQLDLLGKADPQWAERLLRERAG